MFRLLFCILLLVAGCLGNLSRSRLLLPDHRIVGGEKAEICRHPYQLSFQRYEFHSCGASIISRKWAVTAGHCVGATDLKPYRLGAGNNNRYRGLYYNVSEIIRHPQYSPETIDYDIALIKIKEVFKYGPTVQPVRLPETELQAGTIVNITGWGALEQGGSSSPVLMKVAVPIVSHKVCEAAYEDLNEITPRMICAGIIEDGGKDACQGDSGGPLTANDVLYGLVSWGYGCAQPNYPGVYTNVANLRPWITDITGI